MRSKDVCICVCMFNNVSVLLFSNFPSRVHLDIPQVTEKDEWDIELNKRREISYLRAVTYYLVYHIDTVGFTDSCRFSFSAAKNAIVFVFVFFDFDFLQTQLKKTTDILHYI